MAIGLGSTGIHQTTNIKFSEMRKIFKTISPRTTFNGSDDFSGNSGSVSASDLLRNTSISAANPVVPDISDNSNVVTIEQNWTAGSFKNATKYVYLQQSSTDDNSEDSSREGFNIINPAVNSNYTSAEVQPWTSVIDKNVVKKVFVDGVVGSVNHSKEAMTLGDSSTDINNLTVSISGDVIGAAGHGDAVRYVTLTLDGNYSFPIGAAVTQSLDNVVAAATTYVAVGIVSVATNNSNTVQLIQTTDREFAFDYDDPIAASSDAAYFNLKKFNIDSDNNVLYVNDVATNIRPTAKTETTGSGAQSGGNAIITNLTSSSNNVYFNLNGSNGRIYAGGGGGGKGGAGGPGGPSGGQNAEPAGSPLYTCSQPFSCAHTNQRSPGGDGASGGMGGMGRGYLSLNRTGTENPIKGEFGNGRFPAPASTVPSCDGNGVGTAPGGAGGEGGAGGDGGTYGESGLTGETGETGAAGGPATRWCQTAQLVWGGSSGSAGSAGSPGNSGGSSIINNGSQWAWASGNTTSNSSQIKGDYTPLLPSG